MLCLNTRHFSHSGQDDDIVKNVHFNLKIGMSSEIYDSN